VHSGSGEKVWWLMGVAQAKHRKEPGPQSGDKEPAGSWRESFKDLKTLSFQEFFLPQQIDSK
jgi:hypothetical protein